MMLKIYKISLVMLLLLCVNTARAGMPLSPDQAREQLSQIFSKIEEGISQGDAGKFSFAFGSHTYISLSGGNSGYFSSSQAFYMLQDYFNINRPMGFRFSMINDQTDNPYASGTLKYEAKGSRGSSRIFVTLKLFGNNWKISQITIN